MQDGVDDADHPEEEEDRAVYRDDIMNEAFRARYSPCAPEEGAEYGRKR